MKKKLFVLGMAALVLAFGLVVVGCGDGSGGGGADSSALIGTWITTSSADTIVFTSLTITKYANGGDFEFSGTYTYNAPDISIKITGGNPIIVAMLLGVGSVHNGKITISDSGNTCTWTDFTGILAMGNYDTLTKQP